MGIANYTYNRSTSGGEIITHLINSTDGAGLHFNGTSGYVSAGDSTILDGATRFAVEVIAATSSTTEGDVFSKCRAATAFRLYFKADGKIHFRLNNSTSNGDATSAGSYNDGNPKHIVATWDALKLRIYVNGNLDGEGDLVGGSFKNVADFFAIGAQVDVSASASYFNGTVYRARLWNRDVSADVQSLYENASIDYADQWGSQTSVGPQHYGPSLDTQTQRQLLPEDNGKQAFSLEERRDRIIPKLKAIWFQPLLPVKNIERLLM